MGMFDQEPNLTGVVQLGAPFRIEDAEYKGIKDHPEFGRNSTGRVRINGKWYAVYGVLADQINRAEAGEIPCTVTIEREGRAHAFRPTDQEPIPVPVSS